MGDMGDLFRGWNDHKSETRQDRLAQATTAIDEVRAVVNTLNVDPNHTWNIVKGVHKLQYYPTKGGWQYKGKMYYGGFESFRNWLNKL